MRALSCPHWGFCTHTITSQMFDSTLGFQCDDAANKAMPVRPTKRELRRRYAQLRWLLARHTRVNPQSVGSKRETDAAVSIAPRKPGGAVVLQKF
jgi:hypothetical protein